MAVSNLQTNITNISSKLYVISNKLNDLLSEVVDDEYNFDVPQNYKIVEYIQANGSCWCNSGFIPCAETQIYGKFYMASQSSSYPTIFGARNSGYSLSWYSHNMTSGWGWTRNNATSTRTGQTVFQNTTVYLDSTENYKKMKFLDELQMEVGSITWDLGTGSRMQHPLYFFTLNGNGSVDGACYCSGYKIHYIKFYEYGNLVREYCACLDANGTPCFYDTITGTTFYNQGSGSFVAGPVHEKKHQKPYIELEYIQSTGTQYIDTGFKCSHNDNYTFEQECSISNDNYAGANGYMQWKGGITNNIKCNVKVVYKNVQEIIYVNNTQISSESWSSYNENNKIIGIFRLGNSDSWWTDGNQQSGKLYSFKLWKDNNLVRDLIPVKRRADSVVCMYDNISKNYFENAGTGTFIAGPEV